MKTRVYKRVTSTSKNAILLEIKKEKTNDIAFNLRIEKAGIGDFFKDIQGNEELAEKYDMNSVPTPTDKQFLKLGNILEQVLRLRDVVHAETSTPNLLGYREAEAILDKRTEEPYLLTIAFHDMPKIKY
jgi:hypothetical protein